jgi:hypothetical protein
MAGNLGALPGAEVSIELAAELEHFPFQALDFDFAFVSRSEAAQLFDVFFQAFDFALAVERRYRRNLLLFLRGAHYATL